MHISPTVIKVGGSLFDLPDLGEKLVQILRLPGMTEVLLVPGGGATANVVREWDRCHRLGEETSHWLALQALSLNARFLAQLLPAEKIALVDDLGRCPEVWRRERWAVADAYPVVRADEGRPGCLPHSWSVTSDSLAVRIAFLVQARQVILLKSTDPPNPLPPFRIKKGGQGVRSIDWTEAGRRGFVDSFFAETIRQGARPGQEPLEVQAINFRQWRAPSPTDSPDAEL